jgi:hypothetical protein
MQISDEQRLAGAPKQGARGKRLEIVTGETQHGIFRNGVSEGGVVHMVFVSA